MKKIYVVTLAHARADERGGSSGGQPGDQTANKEHTRGELLFQDWYMSGSGWDCCMRAKPEKIRKQMSENAIRAVRNTKIGYSQGNRYSLYDAAKPHGFDCSKVDKPVDCDCSLLMTVCANYAGLPIPKDTRTANMQARYTATKEFKVYTSNKYTKQPDYLKDGDILVRAGHHTVIVANTLYHMTRELKLTEGLREDDTVLFLLSGGGSALFEKPLILNELTGSSLETDGIFGPLTDDVLVVFQLNNGLNPDGIMGRHTAEAMGFLWD